MGNLTISTGSFSITNLTHYQMVAFTSMMPDRLISCMRLDSRRLDLAPFSFLLGRGVVVSSFRPTYIHSYVQVISQFVTSRINQFSYNNSNYKCSFLLVQSLIYPHSPLFNQNVDSPTFPMSVLHVSYVFP